jgi:ferric iron reductase protein FhuF
MMTRSADRSAELTQWLDRLGGAAKDRFYGLPPGDLDVQPAHANLHPDVLRERILDTIPAADRESVDMRAAASRFTRAYCMAVARPVIAALAIGIPLDASLARSAIVWRPWTVRGASAASPQGIHLDLDASTVSATGRSTDEVRAEVFRHLFAEHLALVFERVLSVVKLSPKVLWGSAAEAIGGLETAAAERLDAESARPFVETCQTVLIIEALPNIPGPNPLLSQVRWHDVGRADFPHGLMIRRICCVALALPDRVGQTYCGACPIPPVDVLIELLRH